MANVTLSMKEYEELQKHKKLAEHYKEVIDKFEAGDCCVVKEKDRLEGTLIVHTSYTIISYSDEMKMLTESLEELKKHVGHMCAMRKDLASFEATINNAFIGKHYPEDFPSVELKAFDKGFARGASSKYTSLKDLSKRDLLKWWRKK